MLDPVAKLERSGGDNSLWVLLAVELFAVAPKSLKAKGVKHHMSKSRAARTLWFEDR